MESAYRYGTGPGCLNCYREHCRQQRSPGCRSTAVRDAPTTTTTTVRRRQPQQQQQQQRFDCGSCSAGRLIIAGSFVIGLILVPSTMSAPIRPPQQRRQHPQQAVDPSMPTGQLFWENPCGGQLTFDGSGAGGTGAGHDPMMMEADSTTRREEEIIGGIVQSARQALEHAEQFAGSYVVKTFHAEIKQFHDRWKNVTVPWLELSAYMPKTLDEPLNETYLKELKFPDVLHPVNVGLQRLAVGLEQAAWDQDQKQLPFARHFNETTKKLKLILCEVTNAIDEQQQKAEGPVSRDVMPADTRSSPHNRSLRDWLILREYITGLQYVIETFEYLKSKR